MPAVAAVGKNGNKSAKTRSWEIATKKARQLQDELELVSLGIEPPKKADHITIEAAASLYLDMAQRGIKDCSKARRMLSRLQDYANARDVILLKDVLSCGLFAGAAVYISLVEHLARMECRNRCG